MKKEELEKLFWSNSVTVAEILTMSSEIVTTLENYFNSKTNISKQEIRHATSGASTFLAALIALLFAHMGIDAPEMIERCFEATVAAGLVRSDTKIEWIN